MAEQFDDPNPAPEHPREEPVGSPPPSPPPGATQQTPEQMEPLPVDDPVVDAESEETEEERELREMREAAAHGELELTPEQARRWQHELGLPDAALPANDNESQRQ